MERLSTKIISKAFCAPLQARGYEKARCRFRKDFGESIALFGFEKAQFARRWYPAWTLRLKGMASDHNESAAMEGSLCCHVFWRDHAAKRWISPFLTDVTAEATMRDFAPLVVDEAGGVWLSAENPLIKENVRRELPFTNLEQLCAAVLLEGLPWLESLTSERALRVALMERSYFYLNPPPALLAWFCL